MRRTRIEYTIILILTTSLFLILGGYVFLFLWIFTVILPIISYLLMRINREQVNIKLIRSRDQLYIRVKKQRRLPIGYIYGSCTVQNAFYQTELSQDIFMIMDEQDKKILLEVHDKTSGLLKVCIHNLYITDMLGMFQHTLQHNALIHTIQMPDPIHEESSLAWIQNFFQEGDPLGTGYGQEQSDDAYDVREYEPGDSVHRIHYKLSFKLSKFMIRYFERSDAGVSALFLDFSNRKECEFILSTTILAMKQLLTMGYKLQIYWMSEREKHSYLINQLEDISACMYEILSMPRNAVKPVFSTLERSIGAYVVNETGIHVSSQTEIEGDGNA